MWHKAYNQALYLYLYIHTWLFQEASRWEDTLGQADRDRR